MLYKFGFVSSVISIDLASSSSSSSFFLNFWKDVSLLREFSSKEYPKFDDHQETLAVFSKYTQNWYDSLFPLHKYNCNVLLVVDHTQIA